MWVSNVEINAEIKENQTEKCKMHLYNPVSPRQGLFVRGSAAYEQKADLKLKSERNNDGNRRIFMRHVGCLREHGCCWSRPMIKNLSFFFIR